MSWSPAEYELPPIEGTLRQTVEREYMWAREYETKISALTINVGEHIPTWKSGVPPQIFRAMYQCAVSLMTDELVFKELPAPSRMREELLPIYRRILYAKRMFYEEHERMIPIYTSQLGNVFNFLFPMHPMFAEQSLFRAPLYSAFSDLGETIQSLTATVAALPWYALFAGPAETVMKNRYEAEGKDPDTTEYAKLKGPTKSDLAPAAMVQAYLTGTPFMELLQTPFPVKFTHQDRFNHMHVLAGSGRGKTVLIENLIQHDLASDIPSTIVVIDPHSDLIRKLARSDLGIDPLIIDPRDTKFPIAMNPFALNRERMGTYDDATREQVSAGVIDTFTYLFSGLFDLTGKQGTLFNPLVRFLLSFPETMGRNATILDMLDFVTDPTPYVEGIKKLPERQRDFFMRDVVPPGGTYKTTKDEIRYRLEGVIQSPHMLRLFGATERKVDFFTELNRPGPAVILIDTADDFLKSDSPLFGRIIISLLLQAIEERAAIPEAQRKPTFIYIDEAGSFFDKHVDKLLTTARKFKTGMVLAHQFLQQASPELRASLSSNTGIKFCSGVSAADAANMARDMRCEPSFIMAQPRLTFAGYFSDVTPSAVSIPLSFPKKLPRLSDEAYEALMARNRARVSVVSEVPPQGIPEASSPIPEPVSPPASGKGWKEW